MSESDVVVIDYGVGNLLSVKRALEHCGARVSLSADPAIILAAHRVVLPGVGAFRNAMQALEQLNLIEVIREIANRQIPLLGICLGMQLLLEASEEFGTTVGLGLIPGRVIPVPSTTVSGDMQKIPHIGWSALLPTVESAGWNGTLLHDNRPGEAAYFVHSFMAVPSDPAHCIAECIYGDHPIPAAIGKDQITGCQFHPEKSGEVGLKILRRLITR